MKTKVLFIALLAMLFAVFMAPNIANATYQVPDNLLQSSYLEFTPDPNGPSVLFSVHNTDDDPVTIEVQALNTAGQVVQGWTYELVPYDIKSINMRDIMSPTSYTITDEFPQGIFRGGIVVFTTREVLLGDEFFVNNNDFLADIETLNTKHGECNVPCEKYFVRYLQGGVFGGGTCIDIKHTGGFTENPSVNFQFLNEDGQFTDNFTLGEVPVLSRTCLRDYDLTSDFGGVYIDVPGNDMPTITATYIGFGHFSGTLKAQCIPHCDPCDPLGRCYDEGAPGCGPVCRPPNLTITPGGSLVCQVGVPFNAHLQATGTGLGEITCDLPLPDGITFNPNTDNLTGVCQNMNIPSGTCRVSGQCGADTYTFLVTPPGSTYGVGVAVHPRDKDCLEPGEPTAQAHVDFEITNTGNVPETINLTTSIPGCNFTNILIAGGGNTSRSCVGDFPLGTTTVTATASIVGRPETATSQGQVIITNCPQACNGVQPPTFNFGILNENNSSATTRSNLLYSGPGVSGTVNLSPVPSGGFLGGAATSGTNYDSIYPKTASDYLATANWQVIKSGEVCFSGSETALIHRTQTCEDYTIPTPVFGTPQITLSATSIMVDNIPVTNGLVCDWDPNLPSGPHARPPFGQPATSVPFHCDANYTPPGTSLSCPTEGDISVSIPPQEASCPAQPINVPLTADVTENATFVRVNSITGNPVIHNPVTSPTVPRDLTRPNPGQPPSTTTFTQTGTVTHQGLECPASGSVPVVVQPRTATCADYPTRNLTLGTPITSLPSPTIFRVLEIPYTVSPSTTGTLSCVPSVPADLTRPLFGQTASQTFTCTFTYAPATGLSCTAPPKTKTVTITPQDCATSYPPTWTVPSVTQGSTNLSANNSVGSTGEWELNIHATSSLSECNNHNYDHWYKDSEKVDLACGQGTTALSVSYQWAGHPDEYWRVEVVKDGARVWESSCLLNTHNLTEPSPDKDLMLNDGVVNAE